MVGLIGGQRRIAALLIANRGEIAVRIARTARRLGIRTVAVFAEDDARAMHVAVADGAVRLAGGTPAATYLNVEAVVAAARTSGADALHPGYGFLAENPELAEACAAAGLIFVGPPASAIRAVGDKAAARRMMAAAGAPIVPGYDGADQSDHALTAAAAEIGLPLMIKPAAGGGGKGMRRIDRLADLATALEAARREAVRAFGDDRLILERYVAAPRHVEVQIVADMQGNLVHLLDRDCSLQRRYQKVIEEAPAPDLPPALRSALHACAVTCARAAGYVGAGTVEFLVSRDQFFFMEMNTRLQVEHPVTEAVTGFDLVEWQIRVARGESLPVREQGRIAANGHTIEARLLAEDPASDFLPQAGKITRLRLPEGMPGVRVDAGVREGDAVSVHYDSLIAKIIAHGADRAEANARLRAALAATIVGGVATNRTFLAAVLAHPAVMAGPVDTDFLAAHREGLTTMPKPDRSVLALAAFAALRTAERRERHADPAHPYSPWSDTGGWRLSGRAETVLRLLSGDETHTFEVRYAANGYDLRWMGESVLVTGDMAEDGAIAATIGDVLLRAFAVSAGDRLTLFVGEAEYAFRIDDPRIAAPASVVGAAERLTSPMPGQVVAVMTAAGNAVAKGDPLVIVEAMKMEHTIAAPRDGRVRAVNVAAGDRVAAGVELVAMEDDT